MNDYEDGWPYGEEKQVSPWWERLLYAMLIGAAVGMGLSLLGW